MSQDWKTIVLSPKKTNVKPVIIYGVQKPITNSESSSSTVKMNKFKDEDGNVEEVPVKIDKKFGLEMQKARARLNLSQKQLANVLSLQVSIINDYEKGTGIRVGSNISKIKKFLDI